MEIDKSFIKKTPIYISIIILIGLALRTYNLGKFGLWLDEAVYFVSQRHVTTDPGGMFIIISRVLRIISPSDYFLRFFSVICGIFSIIMISRLGEFLFSKRTGILSALFLGVSPLHIYYSQELTSYSLSVFLALASSYYFLKILENPSFLTTVLYVISTLCFIYNHSINLIFILIQNIFFFIFYHEGKLLRKKWLRLQLFIFFMYLPWLIIIILRLFKFSQLNLYFWVPKPKLNSLLQTFMIFSLGYHASWKAQLVALTIFIYLFLKCIFYWRKKNGIFYLILWLFSPIILLWLISQLYSFYIYRAFLFSLPPLYLLAAAGLRDNKRHLDIGILMLCFLLFAYSLKNYYANSLPADYRKRYIAVWPKKDYKKASVYVADNFREGDVILHICRSSFVPFIYYHGKKFPEYGIKLNDVYREDWVRVSEKLYRVYTSNDLTGGIFKPLKITGREDLYKYKRIWLIHSEWGFSGKQIISNNDKVGEAIVSWFNKNFLMKEMQMFEGINIYLFSQGNEHSNVQIE